MVTRFFEEEGYDFPADQRAFLPGSPARPDQAPWRQVIFFLVSVLLCLTCNLANALVSANAASLMGALGVDSVEMAWLPVVFSMTYLSMNLMLVRFRQQFGLRLYAMLGLGGCCAVIGLHIFVGGFPGAIMVHAAAGVAAAPLSSMAVYYMMTAMPKKLAIAGVILALGFEQIPTPLARLISTSLTDYDQWRSIYIFEFGMTALCFGCVGLFRLPPSEKSNVFRPLDIISFLLISAGMALVCAVVGMGKAVWWFDRDWLGWALAAAVPLLGLAALIESRRAHPLLDLKWLAGRDLIRFTVVAVMSRLVFTEQASVIGLLGASGVNNDELRTFSLVLVLATIAGTLISALIFRPNRLTEMAALVVGLVFFAALFDAHSTTLDRAPQFFASQALIAFATAVFMGPALLFGAGRVLQVGGGPLASFLVLFVATQNLGGLAGGALLGTFQVLREKANSAALNATVSMTDPITAARVAGFSHALGGLTSDAGARAAGGVTILQQEATRQANVLAYNNTFLLVAVLAAATTLYLAVLLALRWLAKLSASPAPKTAAAPTS